MNITKNNNVIIEFSGSSDYYNGALISGSFVGKKYYPLQEIMLALDVSRCDILTANYNDIYNNCTTYTDMIVHHVAPIMSIGYIID